MGTVLQLCGIVGVLVCAFLIGWAVGGVAAGVALFVVGVAKERSEV